MHFRKIFTAIIIASSFIGRADALDDQIHELMIKDQVPGCAVAVIDPLGKVDKRAYGLSNLELDTPFKTSSVFRIASLSKQFCAYAVLLLASEGKVALDGKLRSYIPEVPENWSDITVRQLLSHTSGIADPAHDFNYTALYTFPEYVEILSRKPLAEPPGTKYRYNNHGYAILGELVGRLSKSSLSAFVKSRIFDPLGMKDTRYYDQDEIVKDRVDAYWVRNQKLIRPLELRPAVFAGSGGIMSTLDDMTTYELALREKKVLRTELLAQQWVDQTGIGAKYGFGWHIAESGLDHTGTTFGFTSAYIRQNDGWTIILFRNSDGGAQIEWARMLLKTYQSSVASSPAGESPTSSRSARAMAFLSM